MLLLSHRLPRRLLGCGLFGVSVDAYLRAVCVCIYAWFFCACFGSVRGSEFAKVASNLPLLGTYMRSWDRPEIDRYLRDRGSSLVNLVPRRGYQDIFLERMGIAQLLYVLTRSLG